MNLELLSHMEIKLVDQYEFKNVKNCKKKTINQLLQERVLTIYKYIQMTSN